MNGSKDMSITHHVNDRRKLRKLRFLKRMRMFDILGIWIRIPTLSECTRGGGGAFSTSYILYLQVCVLLEAVTDQNVLFAPSVELLKDKGSAMESFRRHNR